MLAINQAVFGVVMVLLLLFRRGLVGIWKRFRTSPTLAGHNALRGLGDSPETLLTISTMVTYHRVVTAVQGVSLEVKRGQIVALLGNDGTGENDDARAVCRAPSTWTTRVSEGSISYRGQRTEKPPGRRR